MLQLRVEWSYLLIPVYLWILCLPLEIALSVPVIQGGVKGDPVWSEGDAIAFAMATGENSSVLTSSWNSVDNHGGLHVTSITSNGTVIGTQVNGTTICSQESWANATGSEWANALAYGFCNSSVLLNDTVSNIGATIN